MGGSKGGGTKLTAAGVTVLELSEKLTQARESVLMQFASRVTPELVPLSSATLRTSMRNQFPVTITHIARGPALVRVQMRIDDVNNLKATLTQESAQLLGLNQGDKALALFKATSVEVAHHVESIKGSSVISGTVIRSARQDKGGEVTLRLAGGTSLVGFARAGHGLKLGDHAEALVTAQAVVVAQIA